MNNNTHHKKDLEDSEMEEKIIVSDETLPQQHISVNNKRIAKNTLMLYIRMFLNMLIAFYTSRVVLNTLGIDDFGIYGVVGGIIAILGFINSSMAGATSRFLTFELGRNDYERLQKTFSAALTIHIIIAVLILILGETIGLWWLENKLVIPYERMNAARWVFHLAIVSSIITIIQAPYTALIISYERMNVYAYIEIFNSLLKLGIVFVLVLGHFDKLILYAMLTLFVALIITIIYKIYCNKNFSESYYKDKWDKDIIMPMIKYSGWNVFLQSGYTIRTQGINIVLNMFFGPAINAAYSIAMQVQGTSTLFASNFLTAVRPQITKYYASNEIRQMERLVINASKFTFLLFTILAFPLLLECNYIFQIWLKNVPNYAVIFSQIFLIYILFYSFVNVIVVAIQSTGRLGVLTITDGSLFIIELISCYILLKLGYPPQQALFANIIFALLASLAAILIMKYLIPSFSLKDFFLQCIGTSITIMFLASIIPLWLHFSLHEGIFRLFMIIISYFVVLGVMTYLLGMNKDMRLLVRSRVSKFLNKK